MIKARETPSPEEMARLAIEGIMRHVPPGLQDDDQSKRIRAFEPKCVKALRFFQGCRVSKVSFIVVDGNEGKPTVIPRVKLKYLNLSRTVMPGIVLKDILQSFGADHGMAHAVDQSVLSEPSWASRHRALSRAVLVCVRSSATSPSVQKQVRARLEARAATDRRKMKLALFESLKEYHAAGWTREDVLLVWDEVQVGKVISS
jgi:hypothetical protein